MVARKRSGLGGAAAAAWLLLVAAGPAAAQSPGTQPPGAQPPGAQSPGTEAQAAAMARTVMEQLDAFRRGDWAAAYAFASSSIQAQFTLEAFRQMVTRGYAAIADSLGASVLRTAVVDPQRGYVEVRVHGRNGQTIDALYEMVQEQGAWRISGVVAKPAERGDLVRAARRPARAA